MSPADRPTGGAPQSRAAFRFRTRRRLVVAFSVVVAAFVSALAAQILVLERMEATFAQIEDHEAAARLELQELLDLQRAALRWTAALLLVVPIVGALAVAYLSRSVARPLARFSEGAAALAGGDLDTRIGVDTHDEFGALAAELNAMALALKEHQKRLVESEKAAGIGRIVAGVAHEINNPLQVILGYLSLNRDHADRRLARQLALVEEETLRCKRVVEGLVELARPAKLGLAPVDVCALCEELSTQLGISGRSGAVRLSVSGAGQVVADPRELRQALLNLMKNAVEAAGPAGDVAVRVGVAEDALEVAVKDSGPGLAPEAQAHLFEPFFTTKRDGTGLGLAVSRAIARAHGGDIDARPAESGGAVFTLRLPRATRST